MVSSLRCWKDKVQDVFLIAALHKEGIFFISKEEINYAVM